MDDEHPSLGSPCSQCKSGWYKSYKTDIKENGGSPPVRIRYLHCAVCGHLPANNKLTIPLEFAPRQKPRIKRLNIRRIM